MRFWPTGEAGLKSRETDLDDAEKTQLKSVVAELAVSIDMSVFPETPPIAPVGRGCVPRNRGERREAAQWTDDEREPLSAENSDAVAAIAGSARLCASGANTSPKKIQKFSPQFTTDGYRKAGVFQPVLIGVG